MIQQPYIQLYMKFVLGDYMKILFNGECIVGKGGPFSRSTPPPFVRFPPF